MAAYNGIQWIEEQIASIQSQTGVEVHIFISDDSSTDGTREWAENYAAQHHNVTLLLPNEPCGGAARNFFHLLRNTDLGAFDFIAFADQDDRWHDDKLERAVNILTISTSMAYSSNVTAFWADGRQRLLDKAQRQVKWDHYFEAAGPGCTYVMKRAFALYLQDQVRVSWGRLQAVTLHDWYVYALARSNGYGWYIDPYPGLDYRQHLSNQVGANVGASALLTRYRTIWNGWWFGQIRLIEALANKDTPASQRPHWRSLRRMDLIRLSLCAGDCRRRTRDRWVFAAICIVTAITGARIR